MPTTRRRRIVRRAVMALAVVVLISGCCCFMGDAAVPIVSSTDLPETKYSIYLYGPDADADGYFYTIVTPDGDCGVRQLGKISLAEPVNPKLEDLGSGVFRVTWSGPPNEAFATIDTEKKLFVDDSNESNPKNQPFETPRYLRPEYAKLREFAKQEEQRLKQGTAPP